MKTFDTTVSRLHRYRTLPSVSVTMDSIESKGSPGRFLFVPGFRHPPATRTVHGFADGRRSQDILSCNAGSRDAASCPPDKKTGSASSISPVYESPSPTSVSLLSLAACVEFRLNRNHLTLGFCKLGLFIGSCRTETRNNQYIQQYIPFACISLTIGQGLHPRSCQFSFRSQLCAIHLLVDESGNFLGHHILRFCSAAYGKQAGK